MEIKRKGEIIYISFDSTYKVTSTFMRLQEFNESPSKKIRGKYFTLEQFMDEYAAMTGNFTYCSDWTGFNIPGKVYHKFIKTFSLNLLDKEKKMIDLIEKVTEDGEDNFYLIGTCDDEDIIHEEAHAFFALSRVYRKTMKKLVCDYKRKNEVARWIQDMGYDKSVVVDETQAYLATTDRESLSEYNFKKSWYIPKVFSNYFNEFKEQYEA
jgi:hypothetical protein|tara:strand:+ start:396 stop:1025 length:630 start_codon:yes stop_codon:yes gene_type:complete